MTYPYLISTDLIVCMSVSLECRVDGENFNLLQSAFLVPAGVGSQSRYRTLYQSSSPPSSSQSRYRPLYQSIVVRLPRPCRSWVPVQVQAFILVFCSPPSSSQPEQGPSPRTGHCTSLLQSAFLVPAGVGSQSRYRPLYQSIVVRLPRPCWSRVPVQVQAVILVYYSPQSRYRPLYQSIIVRNPGTGRCTSLLYSTVESGLVVYAVVILQSRQRSFYQSIIVHLPSPCCRAGNPGLETGRCTSLLFSAFIVPSVVLGPNPGTVGPCSDSLARQVQVNGATLPCSFVHKEVNIPV